MAYFRKMMSVFPDIRWAQYARGRGSRVKYGK